MTEIDEGSVIGNYRVVRVLGQGGMGIVYEVEHEGRFDGRTIYW